jgi:putative DNA primase/helicase
MASRGATTAYLEAEDAIGAWISERCERDPNGWEALSRLFASWLAWAERAGEPAGPQKRLADAIEARGFTRHKRTVGQGFSGLRLIPDEPPKPHWSERK